MEHLRTSEEERQRVVSFLSDCCADGYLDLDELDARQGSVLRSRTRGELAALVSDMPGAAAVLPPRAGSPPAFVKSRRRRRPAPVIAAALGLIVVMVVAAVPVAELVMVAFLAVLFGLFAVVALAFLSPWLAAGALFAWSLNRLRERAAPPQLH